MKGQRLHQQRDTNNHKGTQENKQQTKARHGKKAKIFKTQNRKTNTTRMQNNHDITKPPGKKKDNSNKEMQKQHQQRYVATRLKKGQ